VEVGKLGDILIVDENPLADVANVNKLSAVIKEGAVIDTSSLPDNPVATVDGKFD
jgi:imidazolonepropionase-like amidohydrolase